MSRPEPADYQRLLKEVTRRRFFKDCMTGTGAIALASLLDDRLFAGPSGDREAADPRAPRKPHFRPRARNVIFLHMSGGPSSVDLFDPKPKLLEQNGKPCPESFVNGQRFAFIRGRPNLLGSPHRFSRHGRSGQQVAAILPHLANVADDFTLVRSIRTDQFNHAPAHLFLHTGSAQFGRPSMGAWLSYGLGSQNQNLPSFVVLVSGAAHPDGGASLWGSGFLPTVHQGVQLRSEGDPVLFLSSPEVLSPAQRRHVLDRLREMNRLRHEATGDPEIQTRIEQYELAYKMQTSVPELMDISQEPPEVHALYGTKPGQKAFSNNCLLARRLVERGVRFVQLYHWGWDSHGHNRSRDIRYGMVDCCRETDQASAALLIDLKRRGLLDETLVIWGGEFGRTPMNEQPSGSQWLGRDHHPHAFTVWLAGGGVKAGVTLGATDELGYFVVEDPVHVHDLQATILHLLGLDHERLTYRSQGRDYRLTDVHGKVFHKLLA